MTNYTIISLIVLTLMSVSDAAQDQDLDTEALLDLPLEDLLNVDIITTSKTSVAIERAPGTVYSFTGEELWANGILTLEDLLRRVPGVQLNPNRQGHTSVWFRGVQGRYNSKLLLLIDGVPSRDFFYGNFTIDEMHPIEHIDKIEVLLGPGSSLHGTNAFAGVISITTKKRRNDVVIGAGTSKTFTGSTHLNYGNASVFLKYLNSENVFTGELSRDGKTRIWEQDSSRDFYTIDFKYELLENLTLCFKKSHYEHPCTYSKYDRTQSLIHDPLSYSLNYTQGNQDTLKFDLIAFYVDYDYTQERFRVNSNRTPRESQTNILDTRYAGLDAYCSKRIQDHTLLLGTSFMQHRATDGVLVTDIDLETNPWTIDEIGPQLADADKTYYDYSIYAQDQWKPYDVLELTFGTRYDNPDGFDGEWSYRFGAVYSLPNDWYTKALFGTAFRVPTYREYRKQSADGTPKFDAGLAPERMKTYELAFGQKRDNGNSWLVTGFYNIYDDYIMDQYVPSLNDEIFLNFGERTVKGIELSGVFWLLPQRLDLKASLTYMDHFDKSVNEELHGLASWLAHVELNYQMTKSFKLGLNANYVSKPHVDSNYQGDVPNANRDPGLNDDYTVFGAFASYQINNKASLQLIGRNISDARFYSPHYGPSSGYDYLWPGAELIMRGRIEF